MEARQLALIEPEGPNRRNWRLDDHTRRIGLEGIARARRALRAALGASRDDEEPSAA